MNDILLFALVFIICCFDFHREQYNEHRRYQDSPSCFKEKERQMSITACVYMGVPVRGGIASLFLRRES